MIQIVNQVFYYNLIELRRGALVLSTHEIRQRSETIKSLRVSQEGPYYLHFMSRITTPLISYLHSSSD